MNAKKYSMPPSVGLTNRQWPGRVTTHAPIWCSVDLRDGNQALPVPMTVPQKIEMFGVLVGCGFKEIEVGFPAASPTEYEFVRRLIEEDLIPDDVTIQVLVQAREDLIKRTVDSLVGARRVIIHMYNSTSPSQRRIVFRLEKPDIVKMAVQGTQWVKGYSAKLIEAGTEVLFQYSPESFSATEPIFAVEICEAVMKEWNPTPQRKIIFNLPETVEVATPNIYADQVEWFCQNMTHRDCMIICVHCHNDRGTGIAATELAMLAGAERVEGTLFGNGERTGNTDIVAVALNLLTQGVAPMLDFSELDRVREVYERCTGMKVPPRQPYSGELVFTAFSGSHQDAIRKGLLLRGEDPDGIWDIPYLMMDPCDVGRRYKEVIRVNGQSGKGGIAYLLEQECGIFLPKDLQREFGAIAGKKIDALGREVIGADLKQMFWDEYINHQACEVPYRLERFGIVDRTDRHRCYGSFTRGDKRWSLEGEGNGPIDAFINALAKAGVPLRVLSQSEHALGEGQEASAIAYIQVRLASGAVRWGAGVDTSIELASIKAVFSALNR